MGGADAPDADDLPFPPVPTDRLDAWAPVERRRETLFDLRKVRVYAATITYEDRTLADRLATEAGVDERTWRFFFASRVALRPATSPSAALTRLMTSRARSGFADQLRDRGFEAVERGRSRDFRAGDVEADLAAFDARVRTDGLTLSVDGWLAVWHDDAHYLLAGGAYPTAVVDVASGREAAAATLREAVSPREFRRELFGLIRATGQRT